ncbi:MAG: hypothetical protein J6D21_02550 [Clostridia bacterium]|nr:hypothetical protein [Clostridia bacterium]
MCEECGYTFLHRRGCPQLADTGRCRCRICDRPVDLDDTYLSCREGRRTRYLCCSCLEEMDLYDIKELFGLTETLELALRLSEAPDSPVTVCHGEY